MASKQESEQNYRTLLAKLEDLVYEAEDALTAAEEDEIADLLDHLTEIQGQAQAIVREVIRGRNS